MDSLKITDENKRKFMSEYAEKHRQIQIEEDKKIPVAPPGWIPPEGCLGGDDDTSNMLPRSLKALSMINFDGKNIQLKDNLPIQTFSLKFDLEWLEEYKKRTGRDWVWKVEGLLIEYLTDTINFEFKDFYHREGKKNLYVDLMVESIELKDDGLYLYSKYEIN